MRKSWFGRIVFCAVAATLGCRAPSPDWNGIWKVNAAKGSIQGQVLTISISADGEYRFDEGSSHTIRCDGKDQPIGNNRTLVCVRSSTTVLDITAKEDGVKTRVTHDELSADGKVFTTTVTEFRPTGPVNRSQLVFSRLSGSDGFAGRWRDANYLQQHADMTLRLDAHVLHIDYPNVSEHIDAPVNGVEAAVRGPHAPEGTTLSVRPAGSHGFLIVMKHHGEVLSQGSLKLSDDGRVITNVWWKPDRPAAKGTLLYEKR